MKVQMSTNVKKGCDFHFPLLHVAIDAVSTWIFLVKQRERLPGNKKQTQKSMASKADKIINETLMVHEVFSYTLRLPPFRWVFKASQKIVVVFQPPKFFFTTKHVFFSLMRFFCNLI